MKVCCGLVPVCFFLKSRARWKQRERELEAEVARWKAETFGALAFGSMERGTLARRVAAQVAADLQKELAAAQEAVRRCDEAVREARGETTKRRNDEGHAAEPTDPWEGGAM